MKKVFYTEKAEREILKLSEKGGREIVLKFEVIWGLIMKGEDPPSNKFEKVKGINDNLYEAKVMHKGSIYRALGNFIEKDLFVVHFFQKKSQKLLNRHIKLALKRLKLI